jgi:hypothetical protein
MSATTPVSPAARSWRDIPQNIASRSMSTTGRRRMAMATIKSIVALTVACVSMFGAYEVWQLWRENPTKVTSPVKNSPLQKIEPRTNGVLDLPWVEQTLSLPKAIDLMELDLYALREKLLATGQVKAAVLTRKFPGTLVVTLEERTPVAQLRIEGGPGEYTDYLVARDGTIFEGACFDAQMISALPYLDLASTKLSRSRTGFAPLGGMETIADLLNTARGNVPYLYRTWKVISLARFFSDGEIVVRSKDVPEIVFGTRDTFYKQIAQLDFILEEVRKRPDRPKTINLAVGGAQVPVAFEAPSEPSETTAAPAERPIASRRFSPVPVQPLRLPPRRPNTAFNRQRPTSNRDL